LPLCTTGGPTQRIQVPRTQNGAVAPSPTPAASASGTSSPLVVSAGRLND
jgi:hypothetical protein